MELCSQNARLESLHLVDIFICPLPSPNDQANYRFQSVGEQYGMFPTAFAIDRFPFRSLTARTLTGGDGARAPGYQICNDNLPRRALGLPKILFFITPFPRTAKQPLLRTC